MGGVTTYEPNNPFERLIVAAEMMLGSAQPMAALFRERCGDEANLVIGGLGISSLEAIQWGAGLGHLKVNLVPDINWEFLTFEVYFRAVDDGDFIQITHHRRTELSVVTPVEDQVVALSAVHESAKLALQGDYDPARFEATFDFLKQLSQEAIDKLKR